MCCFTGPVTSVSATNIFARQTGSGWQFVVYSMNVDMTKPLAMVLPLPVKTGYGDDAVKFLNFQDYPDFFADLEKGFPAPPPLASDGVMLAANSLPAAGVLAVQAIGEFEASFVPTTNDFHRLDKRFRLPADFFKKMPAYHQFGFAVFKLKPGAQTVHPMAFLFPSAEMRLFFPTVHIHDGHIHPRADFDHNLYCQPGENSPLKLADWRESDRHAQKFLDIKKAGGVVAVNEHCYKLQLNGELPNTDTCVELSA